MGYCDTPGLMSVEQAQQQILGSVVAVCEQQSVALSESLGRLLAEDIHSPLDVPPFNNSAMDGYALRAADLDRSDTLTVVGKSFAGAPFEGEVTSGKCVRIMTGAPLPEGADTVVMQERTEVEGGRVRFKVRPMAGDNVRLAGEDICSGAVVLEQGTRLTARELPLLASLGIERLPVLRQPRVAVFSTGDELKPVGQKLAAGEIYDSNRYGLVAMLQRLEVEVIDLGIIPDDPQQLRAIFQVADRQADAVVASGGVSVGEADYTKAILEQLGEIGFWKLAIKPGKPFAFGRLPSSLFFGLPGNPVSSMVLFHVLVRQAIRKLAGEHPRPDLLLAAIAGQPFKKSPGRSDYQRAIASLDADGRLQVHSTGPQGSGVFSSLSRANCLLVLEQERGPVQAGETVRVLLFDEVLR